MCVTDPLHAEYLGCDALHPNVLDCGTGWNWSVPINQAQFCRAGSAVCHLEDTVLEVHSPVILKKISAFLITHTVQDQYMKHSYISSSHTLSSFYSCFVQQLDTYSNCGSACLSDHSCWVKQLNHVSWDLIAWVRSNFLQGIEDASLPKGFYTISEGFP